MAAPQHTLACRMQYRQTLHRVANTARMPRALSTLSSAKTSGSKRLASLTSVAAGALGATDIPASYQTYETVVVLRPDMTDDQRDTELARLEAFLKREESQDIDVNYAAPPTTSQAVQKMLSTPEAGSELNILRHMTLKI